MKKVSIIIPIYNCERYLSDCLKTVIKQTYKNIEVILIDDESTDSSGQICDEYAKKYSYIQVIHQKNAGPGYSRNVGLEICTGDYYTFVDADDYISENMISCMVEQIEKNNADLVEVGNVYLLEVRNMFRGCNGQIQIFKGEKLNERYGNELRATVWGRLYRKDLVGHIRFSDKRIGEDCDYACEVVNCCKSIVKYNHCLYGYRAYQESITRGGLGKKSFKELRKLYDDIIICCTKGEKKEEKTIGMIQQYEKKIKELLFMISYRNQEILYKKEIADLSKNYNKLVSIIQKENEVLANNISEIEKKTRCSFIRYCMEIVKHRIVIFCARVKIFWRYKYVLE